MKNTVIQFILFALIGFGIGYIAFEVIGGDRDTATETEEVETQNEENETTPSETATATDDHTMLQSKGCISCHAVDGLGLQGGATGPDLSQAYNNVEDKHGKPLAEFLKEPTSAVMTTVIAGNPLTDEEIAQIEEELKRAAEAQ